MLQNAPRLEAVIHRSPTDTGQSENRCRACRLHGSKICRAIRGEAPSGVRPPALRRFDRDKRVLQQGDSSGFLGVIRHGYARRSMIRLSGERILLGLAMPGDIVGALPGQKQSFDLEAATDIELCLYDTATLKRQMKNSHHFRRFLLSEIDDQLQRILGLIWRNGTLNSRERIIAFLVRAAEVMPSKTFPDGSLILNMEINRHDWADMTNTAVETISRTLRYLEEKDLITILSPYRFRIRDVGLLATIAGVEWPTRQMDDRANQRGSSPVSRKREKPDE